MRRKYRDCIRLDGNCTHCDRTDGAKDCNGRLFSKLEWARLAAGMSQQELSAASGVSVRQIQKVELGEAEAGNMTAKNMVALADALSVDVRALI